MDKEQMCRIYYSHFTNQFKKKFTIDFILNKLNISFCCRYYFKKDKYEHIKNCPQIPINLETINNNDINITIKWFNDTYLIGNIKFLLENGYVFNDEQKYDIIVNSYIQTSLSDFIYFDTNIHYTDEIKIENTDFEKLNKIKYINHEAKNKYSLSPSIKLKLYSITQSIKGKMLILMFALKDLQSEIYDKNVVREVYDFLSIE